MEETIKKLIEIAALSGVSGKFSLCIDGLPSLQAEVLQVKKMFQPSIDELCKKFPQLSPFVITGIIKPGLKKTAFSLSIESGRIDKLISISFENEKVVKNLLFFMALQKANT